MSYYETLALKMASIPVETDKSNAVFTDSNGGYEVITFDPDEVLLNDLEVRMDAYNEKHTDDGKRCIFVTTPNWLLREFNLGSKEAMKTTCAPMRDAIPVSIGIKAKGIVGDEYLIPDRRQEAAEIVSTDPDLKLMADILMNISLNGNQPFEGVKV